MLLVIAIYATCIMYLFGTNSMLLYNYLYAYVNSMFQTIYGRFIGDGIGSKKNYVSGIYESIDYVAQKIGYFRFLSVI